MNEGMLEIIALNCILSLLYIFSLVKLLSYSCHSVVDAQEKIQHGPPHVTLYKIHSVKTQ